MYIKLLRNIFISLLFIYFFTSGLASDLNAQEEKIIFNKCNSEEIKTIQLQRTGWDLSMPVIYLNSDESLSLHFDYLGDLSYNFNYSIKSCNYNWTYNSISEHRYLEGFNEMPIYDFHSSRNTVFSYAHFNAIIPGEELKILESGNYILEVFHYDNPDEVLFQQRFCIAEHGTEIIATVKQVGESMQELQVQINLKDLKLTNPLAEIKLAVIKNYNWNDPVIPSTPAVLRDDMLFFDMPFQLITPGGSEFRMFDIRSRKYASQGVEYIDYQVPYYHAFLKQNELEPYGPYFSLDDLNGQFYIDEADAIDRNTEADYLFVHFNLKAQQLFDTDIYIYGALTDWLARDKNKLVYNANNNAYEQTLLLKQGVYNYLYVTRDGDKKELSQESTEGNYAESENEYMIFVYLTETMSDFDRLIGYTRVNSVNR